MNAENRSLALVAGGIVAVAVLAVVVVLVRSGAEPTTYPESTPQGLLQRYLAANEEGDVAAAHALFSARIRDTVNLEAYRSMLDGSGYAAPGATRRVLFDGTDERAGSPDAVVVRLTVEEVYGRGIEGDVSRSSYEIPMILEADGWRIDELLVWLYPSPAPPFPAH